MSDVELFNAAAGGKTRQVRRLLSSGASANATDARGIPALMMAAQGNYIAVVMELIQHGCDVNLACPKEMHGVTPLYQATSKGHTDVVFALLDAGADPHAPLPTPRFDNCLYSAAEGGQTDILRRFLEMKVKPDGPPLTCQGQMATPLFGAAQNGHDEIITLLLDAGASINLGLGGTCFGPKQLSMGHPPLAIAAEHGRTSSTALLLACGADPNVRDKKGHGAAHKAAHFRRAEIVGLLARFGCNLIVHDAYSKRPYDAVHGDEPRITKPSGIPGQSTPDGPDNPWVVERMMMRGGVDLTLPGAASTNVGVFPERPRKPLKKQHQSRNNAALSVVKKLDEDAIGMRIQIRLCVSSPWHDAIMSKPPPDILSRMAAAPLDVAVALAVHGVGAYAAATEAPAPTLDQVRRGSPVVLCKLTSAAGLKMNGESGVVISFDAEKQRFAIALDNSGQKRVVKIKAANMRIVTRRDAVITKFDPSSGMHLIELDDGGQSAPMWRDLRHTVFKDWSLFPELRAATMRTRGVVAFSSVCERVGGDRSASAMSDVFRTTILSMMG